VNFQFLFAVLALICFILSALGVAARINLTALGLAFLTCVIAFGAV
jgi:hypothetical protein